MLTGKRIVLFVADQYEDLEFWYPFYRMKEAGAEVTVIGPRADVYASKHGLPARAELAAGNARAKDYDALIIPGGYAPDHMRRSPEMVGFVRAMHERGAPVAAICHAGWMLASAGIIAGKQVTSFYSMKDDMVNAGAIWHDRAVVQDGTIITSRKVSDLPAFCNAILDTLVVAAQPA
jgi:protease I